MTTHKLAWLLATITIIAVGTMWFVTDEQLDHEVNIALNINTQPISNNNGFVYLLGLDANDNASVYELGKTRLLQYRVWLKNPSISIAPTLPSTQTFRAPLWFDGSDEELFMHAKDIHYIITLNDTLYSRYRTFLQFNEFNTLIHVDDQTTDALLENLQLGNRFLRADVLAHSLTGSIPAASKLLMEDINNWRKQLTSADTFAHKLLAARMLEKDFSLMITLIKKDIWSKEALPSLNNTLEPFSLNEISLENPLLHAEFSKIGYKLLEAAQDPTLMSANQNNSWKFKLLYKPNMSVNFLYRQYLIIAQENNLPPRQLMLNLQQEQQRQLNPTLHEWLKNTLGITTVQTLLSINFLPYTARLWDLDVNRLLIRLSIEARLAHINSQAALDTFIQQPRFRGVWDNKSPHYTSNGKMLCYNGPIEDKKGLRCIDIDWLLHKTP